MKLQGIQGFNYNRLACIHKKAGVKSNLIICIDEEGLWEIKNDPELQDILKEWSSFANNISSLEGKVVLYYNSIKFYPGNPQVEKLISLAQAIPNNAVIVELAEGYTSIDDAEIYGNNFDLLPENWETLLTDNLESDNPPDDDYDVTTPTTEEWEQLTEFDNSRNLPRFISKKI
jgi:hypothetical protein